MNLFTSIYSPSTVYPCLSNFILLCFRLLTAVESYQFIASRVIVESYTRLKLTTNQYLRTKIASWSSLLNSAGNPLALVQYSDIENRGEDLIKNKRSFHILTCGQENTKTSLYQRDHIQTTNKNYKCKSWINQYHVKSPTGHALPFHARLVIDQ